MSRRGAFDWDIGLVAMSEYDADGFLGIQCTGNGAPGEAAVPAAEAYFPLGLYARPQDPAVDPITGEPIAGVNALYAWEGNTQHAFPLTDPALVQKLPKLHKGSTFLYAQRSDGQLSYIRLSGNDGSIVLFTPGSTLGSFIAQSDDDGFEVSNKYGRMKLGPEGFFVVLPCGARFDLAPVAGLPSPFDQLGSSASMSAAMVSVDGVAVSLGTDGGAANGLAVAALQALAVALNTWVIAANTAIATAVPASGITAANVSALASQTAAVAAALAALQAVINGLGKVI